MVYLYIFLGMPIVAFFFFFKSKEQVFKSFIASLLISTPLLVYVMVSQEAEAPNSDIDFIFGIGVLMGSIAINVYNRTIIFLLSLMLKRKPSDEVN